MKILQPNEIKLSVMVNQSFSLISIAIAQFRLANTKREMLCEEKSPKPTWLWLAYFEQ